MDLLLHCQFAIDFLKTDYFTYIYKCYHNTAFQEYNDLHTRRINMGTYGDALIIQSRLAKDNMRTGKIRTNNAIMYNLSARKQSK